MQPFIARVSEHTILATSYHYLHLELIQPNLIDFKAGQFISLLVDKTAGLRRSYSVASPPSLNHAIELLINVSPGGVGSKYISSLQPGDQVEFMGPMGSLIVQSSELLFVATGCGISPIRGLILDQLIDKKSTAPIRLWWGMRRPEDCFWEEDFDNLEKEHPNFKWDLVLSQPPSDWPLHAGHVTGHVIDYLTGARNSNNTLADLQFYLCGGRQMIEELSTKLLETGINNQQIHFEKFG